MDPLSDILALVKADSVMTGGIVAGGAWSIQFSPPQVLKFYAVVRGACLLRFEHEQRATPLSAGDVLLLTEPRGYLLATDISLPPRAARSLRTVDGGSFVRIGRGDDFELLAGKVSLDPLRGRLLLDVLPGLLHLRRPSAEADAAYAAISQLSRELRAPRLGASLVARMHAQLLFVELLRAQLGGQGSRRMGWLGALADERLAPSLRLMHEAPGHPWRLVELAKAAGMSRSMFAERFKASAGVAPLAYLAQWRMRLAEKELAEKESTVAQLAEAFGYSSESAFSNAFKRVTGLSPQHFRKRARAASRPVPDARGRLAGGG